MLVNKTQLAAHKNIYQQRCGLVRSVMDTIMPVRAFKDNYIWVIIHQDQKNISCVDPGDAQPLLQIMQYHQWTLQNIMITHHHDDHVGGVKTLLSQFPACLVYAPADSRIPWATQYVHDQETITIDTLTFKILAIPGHTCSHIAYYETKSHWLFCGDTLFSAGCGRVFDGTIEELYMSLQSLQQLPEQTKIFCGHEYTVQNLGFAQHIEPDNDDIIQYQYALQDKACSLPSTLALEKRVNPFLRTHLPALRTFAAAREINPQDDIEIFKQLRAEKNKW